MRSGIVLFATGMLCWVLAVIFRIQHWPIAGFFFILHILFWPLGLLVFLISTLRHPRFEAFMKTRLGPFKTRTLVRVLIALAVLASLANIGAFFKIQHWPLIRPVWWGFSIIATPLIWMFMRQPHDKNPAEH
jgi:hypothetical protein